MTHAIENLSMHEADKQILSVTIQDPDSVLGDITGASLKWEMTLTDRSATALISKSTGSGIVITDGPNRIVEITLDEADTDGLSALGKWFYHEMKIEKSASQPLTILAGRIDLVRSRVRIA